MVERTGIVGLTGAFKENVTDLKPGSKVVFAGSVAVCAPFAELLAYAVRENGFELIYMPRADPEQARRMLWSEGVGFGVSEEHADPRGADLLVILGGLAMPRFGCSLPDIELAIAALSSAQRPKLIGVCFQSILQRAGWTERLPFDVLIDATLAVEVRS